VSFLVAWLFIDARERPTRIFVMINTLPNSKIIRAHPWEPGNLITARHQHSLRRPR